MLAHAQISVVYASTEGRALGYLCCNERKIVKALSMSGLLLFLLLLLLFLIANETRTEDSREVSMPSLL
tara:strand:- start:133 stop:339 length:207 start_codon:yes stop_codon:yes gene_type:complete